VDFFPYWGTPFLASGSDRSRLEVVAVRGSDEGGSYVCVSRIASLLRLSLVEARLEWHLEQVLGKALEALVMTLVAAALLFLWELFCEPWAQVSWVTSQMEQARTAERSANLRKDGDAAIIAQQKIEIISLRSKKSPPLLGHLSSGAQPDIDQICEKLESCPSPELRKRVLRFANKLDDFYLQYDIAVKKEDALSGQAHEAIVRGLRVQMSARYRSDFEPDVLAYRKVVISRLPPGSVDHSQDSLYENQGPGWASFSIIENVNNIAGDLRQLASQLPEH